MKGSRLFLKFSSGCSNMSLSVMRNISFMILLFLVRLNSAKNSVEYLTKVFASNSRSMHLSNIICVVIVSFTRSGRLSFS
jgi:hypothetical protein